MEDKSFHIVFWEVNVIPAGFCFVFKKQPFLSCGLFETKQRLLSSSLSQKITTVRIWLVSSVSFLLRLFYVKDFLEAWSIQYLLGGL